MCVCDQLHTITTISIIDYLRQQPASITRLPLPPLASDTSNITTTDHHHHHHPPLRGGGAEMWLYNPNLHVVFIASATCLHHQCHQLHHHHHHFLHPTPSTTFTTTTTSISTSLHTSLSLGWIVDVVEVCIVQVKCCCEV